MKKTERATIELNLFIDDATEVQTQINKAIDEPDESLFEDAYDDMLDSTIDDFMGTYNASRVLSEVDPIAYNLGLSDYIDSMEDSEKFAVIGDSADIMELRDWYERIETEFNGLYYDHTDIAELFDTASDLITELEELV